MKRGIHVRVNHFLEAEFYRGISQRISKSVHSNHFLKASRRFWKFLEENVLRRQHLHCLLFRTMLQDISTTLLPMDVDYLPEAFRKKANVELNETPERRIQGLRVLKEKAKADKSMRDIEFVDDFLQQFLRFGKYNFERAFSQLRNYVHYRRRFPGIFDEVHPDTMSRPASQFCTALPRRCPDGCTVLLFELGKWDPGEINTDDFKRLVIMTYHQSLRHPMAQINGFKAIHDFTHTSIKHLRHIHPKNLYHLHYGGVNSFPTRFKELHMVTKSLAMTMVWSFVKHVLSEKIQSRVIFHSDPEGLLDHFPRSMLPVHYGGDVKDYYMGEWMREANRQEGKSSLAGQRNFI